MTDPSRHSNEAAAAGRHVDIGAVRLARVYAQAIIEAADAKGARREVLAELHSVVSDVLPKVPRATDVFASPRVPQADKERLLERLFAGKVTPTTLHSLQVLARHGRLGLLPDVVAAAVELADRLEGRRRATFTTATALEASEQGSIVQSFEKSLGAPLAATFHVDPKVIGGLVARIDDTVYDHSVATSLVRLGDKLKQRSIHEIQYRRDRLGTA